MAGERNLRKTSFVLPPAWQVGFLGYRHIKVFQLSNCVNTHPVTCTTLLCGVATAIYAALSLRRCKLAAVYDSVATRAL